MAKLTDHIESTEGVCGGKPCIAGTRIRVQDVVVWHEHQGQTPEEIAAAFPQLSLAQIHSALAYYFDHQQEIRDQMKADDDYARQFKRDHPEKFVSRN